MTKLGVFLFAFASLLASEFAFSSGISINNELNSCVSINIIKRTEINNIAIASAQVSLKKPIGDCGCFSALATYTSTVFRNGAEQILQEGLISFIKTAEKDIVLTSEPSLLENQRIILTISCTNPL
ncbi:DUF2195 family protein [Dentiradicibacter hellwigii]|uniref:DUF2195 family protein n=1 Tax=Dentiradicibacter hellwigii TaxID=3149053 RepID=A0ABV4UAN3_9RHOO